MDYLTDFVCVLDGANPIYLHDCEACIFIGNGTNEYVETVDLYRHERENSEIIQRYGDEGPEYRCMPDSYAMVAASSYSDILLIWGEFGEEIKKNYGNGILEGMENEETHTISPTFKDFVLAGNATVTVHNADGEHFTFRIKKSKPKGNWGVSWFVSLLNGPDNTSNYTYMGILDSNNGTVRTTRASMDRFTPETKSFKVINWALSRIVWLDRWEILPDGYGILKSGRCGRCNRKLTTPESIEIGIGPECLGKLGI